MRAAGDVTGAVAALRQSLELDAGHQLACIDLAEMLIESGQHDEAAALLDAVRQNFDWDAQVAALKLAVAFARTGGSADELSA